MKRDLRIYLDLEYVYPEMTKESGRPTAKNKRQVVQIAAILFDNGRGEELESFEVLTLPTFDRKLPDFFIQLTGITQAQLDGKGIPFYQGFWQFMKFTREYAIWTFHLDQEVLEQNCGYLNIISPFKENFTRVKPLLPQWRINPDEYSSGTLYQAVGLDMNGHVHNALHDVRSMAHAVHILEKGGKSP